LIYIAIIEFQIKHFPYTLYNSDHSTTKAQFMTPIDLIIQNLEDARNRSLKLWAGLPEEFYSWKPDKVAMHCLEMIRHVLGSDYWFHYIMIKRGNIENFKAPGEDRPYKNIETEIEFFTPYRNQFLHDISNITTDELETAEIIRSDSGARRSLSNFLLRVPYHEGVHAGQFLSYLRTLGIERPSIWVV